MEKKKETKRFDLMEFGSALGREEMKKLMAGSVGGGGECPSTGNICKIYTTGHGWGGCSWTCEEAQSWYENHEDITGWCCASCEPRCY